MSFFFQESKAFQFCESPAFARLGAGPGQGKNQECLLHSRAYRAGFGNVGDYSDTTPGNWEDDDFSHMTSVGSLRKEGPAFAKFRTVIRLTPDSTTLTGYTEREIFREISRFTGNTIDSGDSITAGSGLYINIGGGGGGFYPSTFTTLTVTWGSGTVQKIRTGTKTVHMWTDGAGNYAPGAGGDFIIDHGNVDFTWHQVTDWTQDYDWSDFLDDAVALWGALEPQLTSSAVANLYYDDVGGTSPSDGGLLSGGDFVFKTDAPSGSNDWGVGGCCIRGSGLMVAVCMGGRYRYWGGAATFRGTYTDDDPITNTPVSIDSRESTLLNLSSDTIIIAPDASLLLSGQGEDIVLGYPEDYTLPTPDWPAPT